MGLDLVIRNGTLVTSKGSRFADVAIEGETIIAIAEPGSLDGRAADTIDATGLHILPGLIDGHVHFREPGLEHEETWLTGTRAAVFGGVTTILDMPNTIPATDTVERGQQKLAIAEQSAYCDFGIFGLIGPDLEALEALAGSGMVVGLKAFLGPTTGGLTGPDDEGLRRALELARDAELRVAVHAEDRELVVRGEDELRAADRIDARAHLEARSPEAEVAAIDHFGARLAQMGAAGHILHLSSSASIAAVEVWRTRGVDLTAEATPHHALLDEDVYDRWGGVAKVNPPIRGGDHRAMLMAALANGQVDVVGSDHAPHLLADKQRDSIWDVPAGFAGVEKLLPLMLTEVAAGRLTLERLVGSTSERPAQIWRLWPRKGAVEIGSDADLTLVDLQRQGVIRAAELHGLNNQSPFEGRRTVGAPITTIVRGSIVVRDGNLVVKPGWGRPVIDENDQARSDR